MVCVEMPTRFKEMKHTSEMQTRILCWDFLCGKKLTHYKQTKLRFEMVKYYGTYESEALASDGLFGMILML